MGQAVDAIRGFCRSTQDLGPDARGTIRREVMALTRSLLQAAGLDPDHQERLLAAQERRLSAVADRVRDAYVRKAEETFQVELTDGERHRFAAVAARWERISSFVCQYTARASLSKRADTELALDYLTMVGTVHRMMEMEFLGLLGKHLEEMATLLGRRLGHENHDGRADELREEGQRLREFATDQVYSAQALYLLFSATVRDSQPSEEHVAWVTRHFRPGKALESRLQEARSRSGDRAHLDRISHLQAWDELLQVAHAQGCLWLAQIIKTVRHQLRETYKGETGRPDKEEPTDFSASQQLEQEGLLPTGGRGPDEAEATAAWITGRLPDEYIDPELPVVARLDAIERIERHQDKLTPAERRVVLEVCEAVEKGQITLAGKQEDSLRQLWGKDYGRKRRAFARARKKLRGVDTGTEE